MEIKYIHKIHDYQKYLKNIFMNFSYISDYFQYRIPSIEEYDFYKNKLSNIIIKKIWNQSLIDKRNKSNFLQKKGGIIDKIFLDTEDLIIPKLNSSELLLIQTHVNNDYNYKGIISVNMSHIPYGNKIEYYDINYITKKQDKRIINVYPY